MYMIAAGFISFTAVFNEALDDVSHAIDELIPFHWLGYELLTRAYTTIMLEVIADVLGSSLNLIEASPVRELKLYSNGARQGVQDISCTAALLIALSAHTTQTNLMTFRAVLNQFASTKRKFLQQACWLCMVLSTTATLFTNG